MAIYTHEEIDGNLIDNSAKKELITEIKEILNQYGHFHIGEVDADCSPCLDNTKGNLTHLIEYFSKGYCEVNVYCEKTGDDKIDSYYLNYEEITESNLAEILDLCERYKEIQEEENF